MTRYLVKREINDSVVDGFDSKSEADVCMKYMHRWYPDQKFYVEEIK